MTTWQSQAAPPAAFHPATFWQHMAYSIVGSSNLRNAHVPVRPMPVGMPQAWQPPLTSRTSADAAIKGLPQ